MKKRKIASILIIISLFMQGCNSEIKTDNSTKENTTQSTLNSSEAKNNSQNEKQNNVSTDIKDNSKKPDQNKNSNAVSGDKDKPVEETFFGSWVITKTLASGKVTTLSKEDIESLIGKSVTYSKEEAPCFREQASDIKNILKKPVYKKTKVAKDTFEAGTRNYVTFDKLGIKDESIIRVEVTDEKQSTYSDFYIKDKNTLIISVGMVFFQLERK